ncbi:MAG: ABC transporter ATP-binding protein [Chloroflexota bacterium]|nr:ABC transporter ATP-binding protein [Chloroflexota bacterium]
MSARLELSSVSFGYGSSPNVLRGLHLLVEPGEMTALLGANGCGKTTLLRLASGVLKPQEGDVLLDGVDVGSYSRGELARRVAVLPQELSAPGGWNVREVVSLGRTPHIPLLGAESPADVQAVDAALRIAKCESLAGREYASLSGGQKQRVALAMAVAQEPYLLLLDEPTAHLDLRYRAALLDSIAALREESGLTVLAAMHDPSLAALYFPRLLLMSGGRIIADGAPEEVLTEPLLEEVYGAPVRVTSDPLLGAPLVTVLPARLRPGRGKRAAPGPA